MECKRKKERKKERNVSNEKKKKNKNKNKSDGYNVIEARKRKDEKWKQRWKVREKN